MGNRERAAMTRVCTVIKDPQKRDIHLASRSRRGGEGFRQKETQEAGNRAARTAAGRPWEAGGMRFGGELRLLAPRQ